MGLAERSYMAERRWGDVDPRRRRFPTTLLLVLLVAVLAGVAVIIDRPALLERLNLAVLVGPDVPFPAGGTVTYAPDRLPGPEGTVFHIHDRSGDRLNRVASFHAPGSMQFVARVHLDPGGSATLILTPGVYRMFVTEGSTWTGADFGTSGATFDFGAQQVGGNRAGIEIMGKTPFGTAPRVFLKPPR